MTGRVEIDGKAFPVSDIAAELDMPARLPGLEIGSEIGSGGQRVVLAGVLDARPCAIKVALPTQRARTEREVELARTFDHPSLVRVIVDELIEIEVEGEMLYVFAEELVDGITLTANDGPVEPCDALAMLEQIWSALAYLAERNVVHRDVSPKNIMRRAHQDPRWVLLDVGMARHMDMAALTSSNLAGPGTPRYAAPEQFDVERSKRVDYRTDLFGLGIVTFEQLTGRLPYDADNESECIAWITGRATVPSAGAGTKFDELLQLMMGTRPYDRPRAAEMHELIAGVKGDLGCS